MVLKLYTLDFSPPARAVHLTAEALGLEMEHIKTEFFKREQMTPEYVKMNPQHTVPTLDDEGTIVWDSHAINAYLVNKYGKNDALYPKDPAKRAVVDQRLHFDSGILFILVRGIVAPMAVRGQKTVPDHLREQVITAYEFLDKFLQGHKWLAGDSVTLADFSAIPSVTSLDCLVPIDGGKYPNVVAWVKRAQESPQFRANQKGLEDFRSFVKKVTA